MVEHQKLMWATVKKTISDLPISLLTSSKIFSISFKHQSLYCLIFNQQISKNNYFPTSIEHDIHEKKLFSNAGEWMVASA